jgi:hypothetical protein
MKKNLLKTPIVLLFFLTTAVLNAQFVGTSPAPMFTNQRVGIGANPPSSQLSIASGCFDYSNPIRISRQNLAPFLTINNGLLYFNYFYTFSTSPFGPLNKVYTTPVYRLEDVDKIQKMNSMLLCTNVYHWDIDVSSMSNKLVFRNAVENVINKTILSNAEVASFSPTEIALNSDVKTNNVSVNGNLLNKGVDIGTEIANLKNGNGIYKINTLNIANRIQIGTFKPTYPYDNYALSVDGTIVARKMVAEVSNWADKVFESKYKLMPLAQLEQYLALHKHLPEIPSETQITSEGLDLAKMQTLQMQKIEELTLYAIAQKKQLDEQAKELEALKALIKSTKK